jgi:hypothetical protein
MTTRDPQARVLIDAIREVLDLDPLYKKAWPTTVQRFARTGFVWEEIARAGARKASIPK